MGKLGTLIFPFLILGLMVSCGGKRMKVPEYIVDKEKLVPLLVDIHLTDALLNKEKIPYTEKYERAIQMYPSILLKHNINRVEFDSTIRFYAKYPKEFALIYEDVLRELSIREGDIQQTTGMEEGDEEEL